MSIHTGRPRTLSGSTTAASNRALAAGSALTPSTFNGDAHALLIAIYQGSLVDPRLRMEAATIAIKYEKPALGSAAVQPVAKDKSAEDARRIELVASINRTMTQMREKGQALYEREKACAERERSAQDANRSDSDIRN